MKNCPVESFGFADESESAPAAPELRIVRGGHNFLDDERPARGRAAAAVEISVIKSYIEDWLADADYQGQSKNTIIGKREALGRLVWFLERSSARRCGHFEIKRFLLHVKNGHTEPKGRWDADTDRSRQPVGARCVQYYFTYVRTYLQWLYDEDLIEANPLAGQKQPRCPKPKITPLSIEEIALLLNAIPRGLNRARNEAMIYFLLDTGVRVSELCGLRVQDVDLARRCATVTGKGNKTRDIWFSPDTARVLKTYLKKHKRSDEQALFYSERPGSDRDGISPDGVRRTLKRLGEFAGITGKRVSPHTFRHTYATEFIRDNGAPKALQMLLGHENMQMTYRYVTLAESDAATQQRQHSPVRKLRGVKRRNFSG